MPDEKVKKRVRNLSHRTRFRFIMGRKESSVSRFRLQLEYRINAEWLPVVGSDHNPTAEYGHDVTTEGVHLDIYRDGEKINQEHLMGPTSPATALTTAERTIKDQHDYYIERFVEWHKDKIREIGE